MYRKEWKAVTPGTSQKRPTKPGKRQNKVSRILVIRAGGLGDFILTLPVLRSLRSHWPSAHLQILGKPSIANLAVLGGYADSVTSIDHASVSTLFSPSQLRTPLPPPFDRVDLLINFLPDPDTSFSKKMKPLVKEFQQIEPPREIGVHCAEQFANAVRNLGIDLVQSYPLLNPPSNLVFRARESLVSLGYKLTKPLHVIHPGSGSRKKNWPSSLFAETIRRLNGLHQHTVLLLGEADEQVEGKLKVHLRENYPTSLKNVALPELCGVLANCTSFLGNDSGISHLAAAIDIPVLALFGPTSPDVWRPLGSHVEVLRFDEATPELVVDRLMQQAQRYSP